MTTPSIGVATGTSFNSITGLSSTTPNALGTAAVGTGTTTARADHVHPTTGLGLTANGLNQFAATTSAQLAGVISDETGSGSLVFATSPALVTPSLGVATGTSFNSITALSSTTPAANGTAAVGTSTTVARADHVHPSSGGGGLTQLASGSLTGSSVSLTSISSSYKDLVLVLRAASTSNGSSRMAITVNSSTSGYSYGFNDSLYGFQSTSGATFCKLFAEGYLASATDSHFVITFPDYANSNSSMIWEWMGAYTQAASSLQVVQGSGANSTSAAISSIQIKADAGGAYTWDNGTYVLFGAS